ncbi:MAG TPA: IS30 family transposase [Thermoleophilia bacterium]|jgi:IS30 family transposase
MQYHQITSGERYAIAALRRQGYSARAIARDLQRAPSTVSREVRRNRSADGAYSAFKACSRTRGRRSRSRRNERVTAEAWDLVERYLRLDWSPEQVAGFLRTEGLLAISHETIYVHVWREKRAGGELWTHLRQAGKKRRKRYGAYDSRGRLAGKRHISERPAAVEARRELGHWEIDTVMGNEHGRTSVITLVERATGYLVMGKLTRHCAAEATTRIVELIARDTGAYRTITADNGTEFHSYAEIEAATGALFYFATAHHSWERGTNENTNGLLRQYLPKRTSMAQVTQADCDAIAKKLNSRPRKRLGYRTPEECYVQAR